MSARWMHRCKACGADTAEPCSIAVVTCDAEYCGAHVEDRYGFGAGGSIEVPPGWTRIRTEARTREANGDTMTSNDWRELYYCPKHTPVAAIALTEAT